MARPLMLSNNRMLVGINTFGLVHDFYYPYVGMENHASAKSMRHKVGVWVDNKFSWLDDGNWEISMQYESDTLIGYTKATNKGLGVILEFHDFVAITENVFFRNVQVINTYDSVREIRIFFHQVFQISESTRGDTAMYIPGDQVILDYKGHRAFTVYAENNEGQPFDEYSIGNFGIEGKEGTFKDAEDGELQGNDVEHGQVDTVLRVANHIEANGSVRINYWIAAGMTNSDVLNLHKRIRSKGVNAYLDEATRHWHKWLRKTLRKSQKFAEKDRQAYINSALISKSHIDARGGILASGDSQMLNYARDNYSYCWPRDSAYILAPLIEMGYKEEAKAFFDFVRDVMHEDGYLLHKYLPDRSVGSSWHPALQRHHSELPTQEDETAIVILALHKFYKTTGDKDYVRNMYHNLIQPAARFLSSFIDDETRLPHASYDLWEEKFLTTTYSTAVVYDALVSASEMAEDFEFADDAIVCGLAAEDIKKHAKKYFFNEERGILRKGFLLNERGKIDYDDTLDISSLFGALIFGLYEPSDIEITSTLKVIEEEMLNQSPIGGTARYEFDHYNSPEAKYKGNPWILTTLWVAQIYIKLGRDKDARRLLNWTLDRQGESGILPEQLHPETGEYLSVAPLIWSQAELMLTIKKLYKV